MAPSKKEKKLARRERHMVLRMTEERMRDKRLLLQHPPPSSHDARADRSSAGAGVSNLEVEYVLPDADANFGQVEQSSHASSSSSASAPVHATSPSLQQRAATVSRVIAGAGISDDDTENDTDVEDADRVVLPATAGEASSAPTGSARPAANGTNGRTAGGTTGGRGSSRGDEHWMSTGRRRRAAKISWQDLKLAVTARYGAAAAELVGAHDGNSEDPFLLIRLKMHRDAVAVPRHWHRLRSFLSTQSDREDAVGVVPAAIQALGVDKIRATKDKKADPNQIAFMTAFLTASPMHCPDFEVLLRRAGEVYEEGDGVARRRSRVGGPLSSRLREALGMTAPAAPPPWLYSMQAMRRLPPAYPGLRVPGLNAPIPAGAQWGMGQGQWGEPPRAQDNTFLFPGVMDEAEEQEEHSPPSRRRDVGGWRERDWGMLPECDGAERRASSAVGGGTVGPAPALPAPTATPSPALPQHGAMHGRVGRGAPVGITPVPFQPQSFVPATSHASAGKAVSTVAQEYVRMPSRAGDNSQGTVAMGHVLVPKSAAMVPEQAHAVVGKQSRRPT